MATAQLPTFVRLLRRTVAAHGSGLTDAELLGRFVARQDEAAFELLVWRHGPMVWHTCRRTLHHAQDVEDAFQATFLALVRQARSILKREALVGWLHRVAQRIALRARAEAAKRARFEQPLVDVPDTPAAEDADRNDLRRVLDEEINRLPDKYRVPVILCYLEGKTNAEAARQLGCPHGTILSRLARARQRLQARLRRRGVAPAVVGFGAAWASAATAAVPAAVVNATVKAATGVAAGQAAAVVASVKAAALMEGVLHAMFLTKVKLVTGVLLAVAIVGSGLGLAAHGSWVPAPDAVVQAAPPPATRAADDKPRTDPKELERQLERLQAEKELIRAQRAQLEAQLQLLEKQVMEFKARLAEFQRTQVAPLPQRATLWSAKAALAGHTASVLCVVFSPDGKLLASGGRDEQIRIWLVGTGALVRQFVGHKGGVTHLAFSPDGQLLASVGADNFICLWDVKSGKQTRRLQGNTKLSFRVAFTPDGKMLASAGADNGIQLWDVEQGRELAKFAQNDKVVTSIAFAPDGKTLVSAGQDRTVRLWDVSAGRELRRLDGHDQLWTGAFSPDGQTIAAGSQNGTVTLWDAATGKQLTWHQQHRDGVSAIAFTPDGKALLSASRDRTILSYPLPSGDPVQIGRHDAPIAYLAISPDGQTVASAGEDRMIRLWRLGGPAAAPPTQTTPAGTRLGRLLKELLDSNRSDEQILEALHLAALARLPAEAERKSAREVLAKHADRRVAFEAVLRGLLAAHEFGAHVDGLPRQSPRWPQ